MGRGLSITLLKKTHRRPTGMKRFSVSPIIMGKWKIKTTQWNEITTHLPIGHKNIRNICWLKCRKKGALALTNCYKHYGKSNIEISQKLKIELPYIQQFYSWVFKGNKSTNLKRYMQISYANYSIMYYSEDMEAT